MNNREIPGYPLPSFIPWKPLYNIIAEMVTFIQSTSSYSDSPDFAVLICECVCLCVYVHLVLYSFLTYIYTTAQTLATRIPWNCPFVTTPTAIPHPITSSWSVTLTIPNLFSISTMLAFQKCHIKEVVQYVTFWDFFSLSVIPQQFIQFVTCISGSNSLIWGDYYKLIHFHWLNALESTKLINIFDAEIVTTLMCGVTSQLVPKCFLCGPIILKQYIYLLKYAVITKKCTS